uniref:2c protein n=1 Tax=Tobacco rattle virus TaxID=12295 RepID=Q9YMC9_9VIRU|nr:2c protein [Tobacco rattle virus]ALV82101.1 2c protein [Tobacco rattle virus]ALV82105.1 2c protein [Tobacco rattle virus]ALV82109.1 2c protein [Tobacco rattle virus]CAA08873.1 2c, 18K protein [Tobacco rattle virus]
MISWTLGWFRLYLPQGGDGERTLRISWRGTNVYMFGEQVELPTCWDNNSWRGSAYRVIRMNHIDYHVRVFYTWLGAMHHCYVWIYYPAGGGISHYRRRLVVDNRNNNYAAGEEFPFNNVNLLTGVVTQGDLLHGVSLNAGTHLYTFTPTLELRWG